MIEVGIIEDDEEIRAGIQSYLNSQSTLQCPLAADSVESFLYQINDKQRLDVLLMDIGLPGMSGISGMKLIKEKFPDIEIIMLTVYNDPHKIFDSLCAGASGYLLKNTPLEQIKEAIEEIARGGAPMSPQIARKVTEYFRPKKSAKAETVLTTREQEIVVGLVDGLSYKMIADRMNLSIETVRFHVKHVYDKLHVHSKAEVITRSLRGEI
jgi:DNA-binding NarL/FixJ family response regulator